jgi:hypothetical protein
MMMRLLSGAFIFLILAPFMMSSQVFAGEGSSVRGGGDPCESRFKIVRDDINLWIHQGGAGTLDLPLGLSADQYAHAMLDKLGSASVKCVGPGDSGYPVTIQGTPKVCRFDIGPKGGQITCDYEKFLSANNTEKYVLVHHEYAGLAGIEVADQADSQYGISNQIAQFILDGEEPKLMVKPTPHNGVPYKAVVLCEYPKISNYTGFGVAVTAARLNDKTKGPVTLPTDLDGYSITLSRFQEAIAITLSNRSTGVSVKSATQFLDNPLHLYYELTPEEAKRLQLFYTQYVHIKCFRSDTLPAKYLEVF